MDWIAPLAGAAAGAAVGWVLASSRSRAAAGERVATAEAEAAAARARADRSDADLGTVRAEATKQAEALGAANARFEEAQRLLGEQRAFVEGARKDLENAFDALAAKALSGNNAAFLALAEQRLAKAHGTASADLDARKEAIKNLLAPVQTTLQSLESRTGEIERARVAAYAGIESHVQSLVEATKSLQKDTTSLATALRGSQVSGQWGEIALRNVADLAGLTEHVDYELQEGVSGGGRPDMTVRLPGGEFIAVDSKNVSADYLASLAATAEAARSAALDAHVAALREQVGALAKRDYAKALGGRVDLVVLFLPTDALLGAAFSRAPGLQVDAMKQRVLLATPTTLVALLRTVAIYHQQEALARDAAEIARVARDLYERGAVFAAHLDRVGKGLGAAVEGYNDAVGSFESRFLPLARRLEDLRAKDAAGKRLDAPRAVEVVARSVRALPAEDSRP